MFKSAWFGKVCEFFSGLEQNDFERGYTIGVGVVLGVIFLFLLIRIILFFIFRKKRCSYVTITQNGGDLLVSVSALEDGIKSEITAFKSVTLNQAKIFRQGKNYFIMLFCDYDGSTGSIPEISAQIKERISRMLSVFFGLQHIKSIQTKFEHISLGNYRAETPAAQPSEPPQIELKEVRLPNPLDAKKTHEEQ